MKNCAEIEISKNKSQMVCKCAEQCYICNGEFTKSHYKVRDHCHRTSKYRGAAQTICDMNYYTNRYLPVVVHSI